MRNLLIKSAFAAALVAGIVAPAGAAQILLTSSSVIGDSGSFDSRFSADNIVDRQTGAISESFVNGEYWLNPEGRTPSFITLDMGAAYQLGTIELFNSRNLGDRGTADFEIRAANSLAAATGTGATGHTLGADARTIVAGTLTLDPAGGVPTAIAAQRFLVSETATSFRYIQFRPLNSINGNYGGVGYGLNELRVFDYQAPIAPVPEPATWAMMIGGFGLVGGALRRRGHRPAITLA